MILNYQKILKSVWFKFIIGIQGVFLTIHLVFRFMPYPQFDEFLKRPYSTQFLDRNGNLIQVSSLDDGLRREFTPLKKIPKKIRKILLKAEDQRFYLHGGVDYIAVASAFFQNAASKRTVRGASTITMQLVKIINPSSEKSFKRKISDAINAYKLEARLSKNKILEYYINNVPFGMNTEGITSAAHSFFGKELNQLSLEEICCLSVIPRRPTAYNPVVNPSNCAERAYDLCYEKVTKKADPQKFMNTAENAEPNQFPFYAPHYIVHVISEYKKNNQPLPLQVHLSLDIDIQNSARNYLMQAMNEADDSRIHNGAVLVIDNSDGSVLAWIGNGDFFDDRYSGQIDGVLVNNQMGSSMKPFLYAMALEEKNDDGNPLYIPSDIIADIPKEFGDDNLYIPMNFNNRFNGPKRLRVCLASSLNIPAVTILDSIGTEKYLEKLYELGFDSLHKNGLSAGLGLALGAGEVSLYELTRAFAVFPRDGLSFDNKQIYEKDTARIICNFLSDKGARSLGFGYSQTFQTNYPSIFKTGTANQYQNIVALGATPEFTVGVWMGNFSGSTVVGKTGSSLPAWIAKSILDLMTNRLHKNNDYSSFEEPENYHLEKICSLTGKKCNDICPTSVYEYVKNGTTLDECTWHKNINNQVQTIYPAEYQRWTRIYNKNIDIDYESSNFLLITPKNNTVYYYSYLNEEKQAIQVEAIGGYSNTMQIFYDGKFFKKIERPFKFSLPVELGKHTCLLTNDIEDIQFSFTVE
ncbi:MAG: transglycosylase domain-containing protein [Treponema sp.]|nr:transglycosylase domain-containing protein [Treponema sp.]